MNSDPDPNIQVELEPLGTAIRVSVRAVIENDTPAERERIRLGILKAAADIIAAPPPIALAPEEAN